MEWLQKAWDFLSGKKTLIGSIALWLGYTGLPFLAGQGFDPAWMAHAISFLIWIGQLLIPIGVAHKLAKTKKK